MGERYVTSKWGTLAYIKVGVNADRLRDGTLTLTMELSPRSARRTAVARKPRTQAARKKAQQNRRSGVQSDSDYEE